MTVKLKVLGAVLSRSIGLIMVLAGLACGFQTLAQSPTARQQPFVIPAGTILPVKLNHGFTSKNAREGQVITGRLMQDVPLPNTGKIPEGAMVAGTIIAVEPASNNAGGKLCFRFNEIEIHKREFAIVTNLRALASMMDVLDAQIPETTAGFGTPYPWVTTQQVGGDEKYGVGGPVTDRSGNWVGQGVFGGVLVHVRAQSESKCRGPMDREDRLQALWVFSADACGVYGMGGVDIVHAGRTDPVGEIVLTAESGDLKVHGGSGMLLRVIR
jgi:hypothetical protein